MKKDFLAAVITLVGLLLFILALKESFSWPVYLVRDFSQDYSMARALRDGLSPYAQLSFLGQKYLGWPANVGFPHPSPHSPLIIASVLPLSYLSFPVASACWSIVQVILLWICFQLLVTQYDLSASPKWRIAIFMSLFAFAPVSNELVEGQINLAILLCALLALSSFKRAANGQTGIWLGLSLAIKPLLWPTVLLFIIFRNWRAVAFTVTTYLAVFLVLLPAVGLEPTKEYFINLTGNFTSLYETFVGNISVWSVASRLFLGLHDLPYVYSVAAPPLVSWPEIVPTLQWLSVLLVLLFSVYLVMRTKTPTTCFWISICCGIIINPIAWVTYLIFTIAALAPITHYLKISYPFWPTRCAILLAFLLAVSNAPIMILLRCCPTTTIWGSLATLLPLALTIFTMWYLSKLDAQA